MYFAFFIATGLNFLLGNTHVYAAINENCETCFGVTLKCTFVVHVHVYDVHSSEQNLVSKHFGRVTSYD